MPMIYPQVEPNTLPLQQFKAPETKNLAAEQAIEQGKAMQQLGDAMVTIEDMRATASATKGDNELVASLQDLTLQYNQLHGEEAVKARDGFVRLAQNKADEIKARSTSPLEREMVGRVFAERLNSFVGRINTSYVGQLDKWGKTEAAGRVTLASQKLYDQWAMYDPKKSDTEYNKAKAELNALITAYAKREGLGPEATEAYRIREFTKQHKQILGAMISNNQANVAQEYLKQHINEIEAEDRPKLQEIVKKAGADQKGMNLAMEMKTRFLKGEKFDVLMDEGFKQLGGGTDKLDTETFKVFRSQFTADRGDVEKAWSDEALMLSMPVNKAILERESTLNRRLTPRELAAIPEFTQMRMSNNPKAVQSANKIYDEVTREHTVQVRFDRQLNAATLAATKQARKDQIVAQSSLTLAKYTANPQLLATLDDKAKMAIEVSLDPLHRGQWKTLVEHTTSNKALTTLSLNQQQFDNMFREMGWTDKTKIAEARNAATAYLINEQKEKGWHFDRDTAMKALSAGVMEVEVKAQGSFLGIPTGKTTMKIPLMNVKRKENIIIPNEDKVLVQSLFDQKGIKNPTTQDVMEMYQAVLADRQKDRRN